MTIGQSIKKARLKQSYSRCKLAKLSNVSDVTIKFWEEDISMPRIDLLICVADALEISLDELVGRGKK